MRIASLLLLSSCFLFSNAFGADPLLADRHVNRGLNCQACHTAMPMQSVPASQCLSCHGPYAKLAKRTDKKDINPHDSHIEEADCGLCHRGHKKPVFACDECHEFKNIKVP